MCYNIIGGIIRRKKGLYIIIGLWEVEDKM